MSVSVRRGEIVAVLALAALGAASVPTVVRAFDAAVIVPFLGVAAVFVASACSPALYLLIVCAVGNNLFGLVDLTQDAVAGLIAMDLLLFLATVGLVCGTVLRGELRDIERKLGDARAQFLFGIVLLTAVWCGLTLVFFDQSAMLTLKAARPMLYYLFGFWGLCARVPPRRYKHCVSALAIGGMVLSALVVLGFFFDLQGVLPGMQRFHKYLAYSQHYYRTVPLGYEFIYLAFFLVLFGEKIFSRGFRAIALTLLSLGVVAVAFRAYWIGMVGAVCWLYLRRNEVERRSLRWALGAGIFAVGVLVSTGAHATVAGRAMLAVEDIETGHGSISIRLKQVAALMPYVRENPVMGVGFLHASGPYGTRLQPLKGLLIHRFGTSDVGWMDILVRFGFVGSFVFGLLYFFLYCSLQDAGVGAQTSLAAVILTGAFALPGAALFSIPNGVLTIALTSGLVLAARAEESSSVKDDTVPR
ncbi:MAG: O-antigen ligase family protein [Steroidobacteraceae bacterium]|nr:O-antigen ligase family protein [Steroidobacteraceae bacterium]